MTCRHRTRGHRIRAGARDTYRVSASTRFELLPCTIWAEGLTPRGAGDEYWGCGTRRAAFTSRRTAL